MNYNYLMISLALLALMTGCSDSSTPSKPAESVQSDNAASVEVNYERVDCAKLTDKVIVTEIFKDKTLECGLVTVPADWSVPAGDTIKIAVYRLPSTAKNPAADPVVYLEGGPGGSGVATVAEFAHGDASYLRERSDVIIIDQRGTGFSQPALFCPEVFEAEKNQGDIATAHTACRDRFITAGVRIADYNSHNNALDVGAVRKALGYKEWNLYGLSYGTRLATTVMRDASKGVRSVVLDSVFPAQVNGLSETPYTYYWAVEQIAENCAKDNSCATQAGDVKGLIEDGIERLAANPVGEFGAREYVGLLGDKISEPELLSLVGTVARGTDQDIERLQAEITAGSEEENPDLTQLPPFFYPLAGDAEGMGYSVICAEEFPFLDIKASPDLSGGFRQASQTVIDSVTLPFDPNLCQVWNVPPADAKEAQAISSDIPTLVLAGTADIATPPEWARIAARTLPHSQYAEFAGLTHGLLGNNACLNNMTLAFLDAPGKPVDQSCIATLPTVKYELN